MKALLLKYWDRVRSSLWFVPSVMACMAVALAASAVELDKAIAQDWLQRLGWSYSGGAEGASLLLGTVAGSMIAIAGTVFSMTLVALSLASSQLGPRLLRNFMRDTANQVVLGTFVATFVYCLLVLRTKDGYLQLIDADALMALAAEEDLLLRLERRPGHYIVKGRAIVLVWPGDRVTETLVDKLNAAFMIGSQRTAAQDIEFSFHQLVEIAVRALSPGINDPFTAIACVDRLGSGLCRLARRDIPSAQRFDPHGRLRLVAPGSSFAGIVDTAFNQIRQSARSNPAVAIRMLDSIAQIAGHVQRAQDAACLQRQAGMMVTGAREAVPEPEDLLAVEVAFMAATLALCEFNG